MPKKQLILFRTTCFFWLVAKLLSYKVWLADRLYPVIPLFDFTEVFPSILHAVLYCSSLAGLIFLLFSPKNKAVLISLVFLELFSCLLDVTRWQPWEYQYIFIALIFLFNKNKPQRFFAGFVFLMSAIYILSGLHKMNGAFLYSTWEQTILHHFIGVSPEATGNLFVHYSGTIIPLIEIVAGVSLLMLKNKKPAVYILMGMHVFILIMLISIDYNYIVWPWNIAMICLLYFLFLNNPVKVHKKEILKGANVLVVLFWGILPLFSFIGHWDLYLSSGLYSGKEKRVDICLDKIEKVPELKPFVSMEKGFETCNKKTRIRLHYWAFSELMVPPYPEIWYYKKFKKNWIEKYHVPADFVLYFYPYKKTRQINP